MCGGSKPNQALVKAVFSDSLSATREALFEQHLVHPLISKDVLFSILQREKCDTNIDYVIGVLENIESDPDASHITTDMVIDTVTNPECPSLNTVITKSLDEINKTGGLGDASVLPQDIIDATTMDRAMDSKDQQALLELKYTRELEAASVLYKLTVAERKKQEARLGYDDYAMIPNPQEQENAITGPAPMTPFRYALFDGSEESESSLEDDPEALRKTYDPNNPHTWLAECNQEDTEKEKQQEEEEDEEEEEKAKQQEIIQWTHKHLTDLDTIEIELKEYSWFLSVWYRVNTAHLLLNAYKRMCGRNKLLDHKVTQFVQKAHLDVVRYLDSVEDPRDCNLDELKLTQAYGSGMGESFYHDDRNLVTTKVQRHKAKRTPLEIIRSRYPEQNGWIWTAEDAAFAIKQGRLIVPSPYGNTDVPDMKGVILMSTDRIDGEWAPFPGAPVDTHSLYYGCIHILNQCQDLMDIHRDDLVDDPLFDALWAYYVAFSDLFYFCLSTHPKHKPKPRMDDEYLLTSLDGFVSADGTPVIGDRATPWELYGQCMDTRAFHAGDLPDLFNVLIHIPLWGEQNTPVSMIGRLLQKSLPFACQRRRLIKLIVKNVKGNKAKAIPKSKKRFQKAPQTGEPGFWLVFAKLFWVMLSGLYPGELGPRENKLGMRELLRFKELTDPVHSKNKLIEALEATGEVNAGGGGAANGGPLVVFTSFRLFILYMGMLNPHYVETASKCVDWEHFKTETIHMAYLIRGHNMFPSDPFAQARKLLSRTIKNPGGRVHRLRRRSLAVTLKEHCNTVLEKEILKDLQRRVKDLKKLRDLKVMARMAETQAQQTICINEFLETNIGKYYMGGKPVWNNYKSLIERAMEVTTHGINMYHSILDIGVKSAIVNILLRIPPRDRLTVRGFCLLSLEKYGAVESRTIASMVELVNVYHKKAVPKEYARCINTFKLRDFTIVCFYFNMVAMLEQYKLIPLDADTIKRTDMAMMTRRHLLFPGQKLADSVYDVTIALCCNKVCNLTGKGQYGDKKVAFDIERRIFVCAHNKKKKNIPLMGAELFQQKGVQSKGGNDNGNDDDDDDDDDDDEDGVIGAQTIEGAAAIGDDIRKIMNPATARINAMTRGRRGAGKDRVSRAQASKGRGLKKTQQMEDRKELRNARKNFSTIPCGQPVLNISLRGYMLVCGSTLENQKRYMFCPECGAFHNYNALNHVNSPINGRYRCNECAQKEMLETSHLSCAYCKKTTPGQVTRKTLLSVFCPTVDPQNPNFDPITNAEDVFQQLYFCRGCYNIARRYAWGIPKEALWKTIAEVKTRKMIEEAMGKHIQRGAKFGKKK